MRRRSGLLLLCAAFAAALAEASGSTGAASGHGIEFVRDPLSFCIELHDGQHEFRIRLRNNRGVRTRLTISVENGRQIPFLLPSQPRLSVLQGVWNGRHHASGCRATISWDHTHSVVTLPLAQQ